MKVPSLIATGLCALGFLTSSAGAQNLEAGSLLLFPEYDNRVLSNTVITVTNTNPSEEVWIEYIFIGRKGHGGELLPCLETNLTRHLTPNDTLTILTEHFVPQFEAGYLYVFAKNQSGQAINFNWLVGNEIKVDLVVALDYAVNPTVFLGAGEEGSLTDVDGDGHRDLDGVEYSEAADQIIIPRFFGQKPIPVRSARLLLVALSGGIQFDTILHFLIYNDNEVQFSAQYQFRCWDNPRLEDINGVFSNEFLQSTDHDEGEVFGLREQESGWILIDGLGASSTADFIADPAFTAYLVETGAVLTAVADLPFSRGSQDNGSLLPIGPFGDNND